MPAAPPGVLFICTLSDETGIVIQFQVNYSTALPLTSASVLTGGAWTNNTGKPQGVAILDDLGAVLRTVRVPVGAGNLTANQLNRAGFFTAVDCNGLTFDLA